MFNTKHTAKPPDPAPRHECASLFIHGIGTAVPDRAMTQGEAVSFMESVFEDPRLRRLIRRVSRQSDIAERHLAALAWQDTADRLPFYPSARVQPFGPGMGVRSALFDVAANDLVRRSIDDIPTAPFDAIQTLVTVSCTHASSPGLEQPVFECTSLPHDIQRWNLGFMGCSAGLAAVRLIQGLTPEHQHALICTCELSSLHFQYSEAIDQITANMLFADGAAAVVLSTQPSDVAVLNSCCVQLPSAADQMIWSAGDHGLCLKLSRALPDTLAMHVGKAVDQLLADCGKSREEIAHWLAHPGGPKILDAVESALELSPESLADSRGVLHDYGNMSSSTIFFVLNRLLKRDPEGLCITMAFGPGLTIEVALLEIDRNRNAEN
jgi:predicted naringenin-chalcone synthase